MKGTFDIVRVFARQGRVLISDHADDRMNERNIAYSEVVAGVEAGVPIEEYLTDERGPAILVLQKDRLSNPLHVLWAIPASGLQSAVLVTAYRPDEDRWTADFRTRRK